MPHAWYTRNMKVAIILNSGRPPAREVQADKIICCDGGINYYEGRLDILLGDFDSITRPQPENVGIVRHDPHKNASDGELAVYHAIDIMKADSIVFYGVTGGRYDHMLGNFAIMSLASEMGAKEVKAEEEDVDIYFAKGDFRFDSRKGDLISVVPYGAEAFVKTYKNLEYPLENLLLTTEDTRGISNVSQGGRVRLDIETGKALVFHYLKNPRAESIKSIEA